MSICVRVKWHILQIIWQFIIFIFVIKFKFLKFSVCIILTEAKNS